MRCQREELCKLLVVVSYETRTDADVRVLIAPGSKGSTRRDADAVGREAYGRGGFVVDRDPDIDPVPAPHVDLLLGELVDEQTQASRVFESGMYYLLPCAFVLQQVGKDALQEAAAPTLAQMTSILDGRDDLSGSAHRGKAKIGAVGLGEALDVDRLGRYPPSQAKRRSAGNGAGRVIFNDENLGFSQQPGDRTSTTECHRDSGRVLCPRLDDHCYDTLCEGSSQLVYAEAFVVHWNADDLDADGVEKVHHRRKGRCLKGNSIADAERRLAQEIEGIHGAIGDGKTWGLIRPFLKQPGTQLRQHGIVEVARRRRRNGQTSKRCAVVG